MQLYLVFLNVLESILGVLCIFESSEMGGIPILEPCFAFTYL